MAVIIVKPVALIVPTDPTDPVYLANLARYNSDLAIFESQLEGIRLLSSTELTVKLTETQLPESFITNDVYLREAERVVLLDTANTSADVSGLSPDSDEFLDLVYLVQLRVTIEMIPQIAQIVRESLLQDSGTYQEIDWEKRIERFEKRYSGKAQIINPAATTSGTLNVPVALTTSRRLENSGLW